MKRFYLFFFLSTIIANLLTAQKINFGVKSGLNYSNTIAPGDDAFLARTSFHAGVFVEIPLKGRWSFHPEIMYSSQGSRFDFSKVNFEGPESGVENDRIVVDEANFLIVPLITRFNFNELISLELGPQVGFLLSEGSFIDYGPTLGVGFDIRDRFKIQLRSYLGISDVFRKSFVDGEKLSDKTYYSLLQLSLGYVIF